MVSSIRLFATSSSMRGLVRARCPAHSTSRCQTDRLMSGTPGMPTVASTRASAGSISTHASSHSASTCAADRSSRACRRSNAHAGVSGSATNLVLSPANSVVARPAAQPSWVARSTRRARHAVAQRIRACSTASAFIVRMPSPCQLGPDSRCDERRGRAARAAARSCPGAGRCAVRLPAACVRPRE